MKSSARPVLSALRQRFYSAQTAAKQVEQRLSLAKEEPKISRLPNGTVVASLENYSPIARVSVVYNAGSRFETRENAGITHCLRNIAQLSAENASGFGIVRNIGQIGGALTCSTTRENVSYTLDCLRSLLPVGIEYLGQASAAQAFKWWEIEDAVVRHKLDLAMLETQPDVQLMEALHRAAYRDGLGNGLFMPSHRLGTHGSDMLKDFADKHLASDNMAVIGVGVDHNELVRLVQAKVTRSKITLGTPGAHAATVKKATYYGGDGRIETNNSLVHAAVVTEGVSLGSKDAYALAVLQRILGGGPRVKYSSNLNCKVNHAVAKATNSPFATSCININYSDTGLFGFCTIAQAKDIGKVLKEMVGQYSGVTKGGLTDKDVQRGKMQVISDLHMELETTASVADEIAAQVMLDGQIPNAAAVQAALEKVTTADVTAVAKKVINGKPTMAAVGDLSNTPYIDELL